MNLLQLLNPEILESINLDFERYPHYVEALKKELEENRTFLYLSVNTASNICMHAKKEFNIVELSNCFTNK